MVLILLGPLHGHPTSAAVYLVVFTVGCDGSLGAGRGGGAVLSGSLGRRPGLGAFPVTVRICGQLSPCWAAGQSCSPSCGGGLGWPSCPFSGWSLEPLSTIRERAVVVKSLVH